ncbi:hypothetical protein [Streptomyces sp. NPDC058548]|uniref:hypothetical protein n=1 Tax=Streptomyces sp. NPDC058548 TaxID=3346545 RepID=UPI0036597084
MYQYRCEQCRTTSPQVITRHGLDEERAKHRRLFHGGHIPDGEKVLEPERFNFFDLPREQLIFGPLIILVFIVGIAWRHL